MGAVCVHGGGDVGGTVIVLELALGSLTGRFGVCMYSGTAASSAAVMATNGLMLLVLSVASRGGI